MARTTRPRRPPAQPSSQSEPVAQGASAPTSTRWDGTIPEGVLARARLKPVKPTASEAQEAAINLFRPAKPHPGVVPSGVKMAMDDGNAAQFFEASAQWAGLAISGAIEQGQTFLGYAYLAQLSQRVEYRRVVETIASEMTREWITLKGTGSDAKGKEEKIKKLDDAQKRYELREVFRSVAEEDGNFGRAHLYIDTGDTEQREELKKSIGGGRDDTSKVKVTKDKPVLAFRPVEPMWTYPINYNANDPLQPDWYKPTSWFVMGKEIHSTRLLTFVSREVPDILKPAYAFGGLSLIQMVKSYVDKFLYTTQSIADLIHSFSIMVLLTNMAAGLSNEGRKLFERVDLANALRDNRNMFVADKETEDLKNISASLATLDALQAQAQEHICSASGLPLIKYTGLTPTGLNASSEGEIRSFYDWIHASQEFFFRKPLQTCLDFIQLSEFGEVDPEIVFEFKSLWQLDEAGLAAVQQIKAAIHEIYLQEQVVSNAEVRRAVAADADSPYAALQLDPEDLPEPPAPPPGMQGEGGEPDKPNGAAHPGGEGEGRSVGRESISAGGGGRAGVGSGV